MSYELNRNAVITGCVNCFCLACGTFLSNREDAASHIVTVSHCENLRAIPYSDKFNDQYIRKFKSGYYCEFCNKLMPTVMHVNLHLVEEYHKDNRGSKLLQAVGNEVIAFKNIVINERSWHGLVDNICCICVTEFEDEAHHKAQTNHVLGLIRTKVKFGANNDIYRHVDDSFMQCMTCNKLLSVNAMSNHFNDTDHISLYEKCKPTAHIENTVRKNTCENVIATNIITRDFLKTERLISAILPYPDDEDKYSFEFKEVLSDKNNESSDCSSGPTTVVPIEHLEVTIQTKTPDITNQNVHKFESNEDCSKNVVTDASDKNTKVSPLIKNPDTRSKAVNEIEQNEFSLVNCNNIPESDVLDIKEPSIQIRTSDAICQNDNKIVHNAYSLIEKGISDYNESHETMEYTNKLIRIKTSEAVCQDFNKYETNNSVCIESPETDVRNKYMKISTQIKIPDVVREDVSKTVDYENSFLEKGRTYCICSPDTDLINENTVMSTQIENPDVVCQDVNKTMCNKNCFIERGDSDCSESPKTDVVDKRTEKNLDTVNQDITFGHDEDSTFKSGNFDCNQNFGTDVPKAHSNVTTHTKYLEIVCPDANKFELTKDPVFESSTTNSETNEIYASNNNIHYKANNKNSFCNICQINIPSYLKGMKEHVEGGRHNKNILAKRQTLEEFLHKIIRLERTSRTEIENGYLVNDKFYISILSQMLLVKNGLESGLKCLICGVILASQTIVPVAHIDSCCLPNSRKMPVLTYKEDEYIREIRPKLFHCGFCHIVASGWDEMAGHLKSSEHDRHKSEAYSEYRFIVHSLKTRNHMTIYNNGLIVHYSLKNLHQ